MTGSAADVLDFQLHVAKINGANVFAIKCEIENGLAAGASRPEQ
jgi:hypothetical protein